MTTAYMPVRAARGNVRTAKGWIQEAAKRMLMNNLDPQVAEKPEDLIVYGGRGKAARNWECFHTIVETLDRLENNQTLLVQSGKAVAVLETQRLAPRVLIANSNLVPKRATWEEFDRLDAAGLMMYGQMTAGSWIYIGTQGILQGTYETFRGAVHSEQFHSIGGLELAVKMGALSVDHLEACGPDQLPLLASSSTIATILPGVSLHLGIPATPGRKLIDAGAAVAVGTDLNPGSSPLFSTALALGLAVRLNGLSPAEALTAGTVNAASALGLNDIGRLEAGMRADFLVLEERDWRSLVYTLGSNPVREVWIDGKRVGLPSTISAEAL